jgi:possible heptosyltransferase II (inner core)
MKLSRRLILHFFGHKKPCKDFDFTKVHSILIRPVGDAVGDAVAHISFVRQLRAIYPNVKIGMFVTDRNRDIIAHSGEVDELIEDIRTNYWKQRGKWQLFLDFFPYFYSWYIIKDTLLKPQAVMIFNRQPKKHYTVENVRNYDFHCPTNPEHHMIQALETSEIAKYHQLPQGYFKLHATEGEKKGADIFWNTEGRVRILLAPQGSAPSRSIPLHEMANLLNRCNPEIITKAQFLMCNTKGSEEYIKELRTLCCPDIRLDLAPKTSLFQYMMLVASCDIALCIDSGTVHLACAYDRPLLAFYAHLPSNINLWHPLPNENIPCLTVISSRKEISKRTSDFPLDEAINWLNTQIAAQAATKIVLK